MRLDTRHYELLLAIERTASISGAARDRGMDQAGVSRTLRRIEAELGVVVFERDAHGARPTPAGRDVLARARAALDAVARLENGPAAPDRLRVLLADSCADFLAQLYELRPALDVLTSTTSAAEGIAALLAGEADVLIGVQMPHSPWPWHGSVSAVPVGSERLMIALPASHRLAGAEEVDLADLADEDWIVEDDPERVRFLVGECRTLGGFEPRIRYRTTEGAKALLLDGAGVKLVSELLQVHPQCVMRSYRGASSVDEFVCHVDGALPWPVVADVVASVRQSNDVLADEVVQFRAAEAVSPTGSSGTPR